MFGLSPVVWLVGLLLAVGGVGFASHQRGYQHGYDRAQSERAIAQDQAIKTLSEAVATARADAIAEAGRRAAAIAASDRAKAALADSVRELRNAKDKPAAACVTDDWRMRVNQSIDAANAGVAAESPAARGVPDKVPTAAETGTGLKRLGSGDGIGVRGVLQDARPVQAGAVHK